MKILVVSNFFPPFHIGGYEQACLEFVQGFKARGHQVNVLTSTYRLSKHEREDGVYRLLMSDLGREFKGFYSSLHHTLKKESRNQNAFTRVCRTFKPDLVYLWNLTHISISLGALARRSGIPVVYSVFDIWLSIWDELDRWYQIWNRQPRRPLNQVGKMLLTRALPYFSIQPFSELDLQSVHFASHFLCARTQAAGKLVRDARVIPWGVPLDRYPFKAILSEPKRLLFVSRFVRGKAAHVAIQALDLLVHEYGYSQLTLTLVGAVEDPAYYASLQDLVRTRNLENCVRFISGVSRDDMPAIYAGHDILIFPSAYQEGFGLTLIEAMAMGLAVVATALGGSAEIAVHESNALIFPTEDAEACARQTERLLQDPPFLERLRQEARRTVERKFRIEQAFDAIETDLLRVGVNRTAT